VLADADTGLGASDVFYFGNAIGETGDTFGLVPSDGKVNATDQLGARSHPHTILDPAPLYDAYDFNRDKKVNATDELIARNNQTTVLNALKLITVPAVVESGVFYAADRATDNIYVVDAATGASVLVGNAGTTSRSAECRSTPKATRCTSRTSTARWTGRSLRSIR